MYHERAYAFNCVYIVEVPRMAILLWPSLQRLLLFSDIKCLRKLAFMTHRCALDFDIHGSPRPYKDAEDVVEVVPFVVVIKMMH